LNSDLLNFIGAIAAACLTAAGVFYTAFRTGRNAKQQTEVKLREVEGSLEQFATKAMMDVYKVVDEKNKELGMELREERKLRADQGTRLNQLENEFFELKGAHQLLLRLQCPKAQTDECPVFRRKPPGEGFPVLAQPI
jgi:hypothetical protein